MWLSVEKAGYALLDSGGQYAGWVGPGKTAASTGNPLTSSGAPENSDGCSRENVVDVEDRDARGAMCTTFGEEPEPTPLLSNRLRTTLGVTIDVQHYDTDARIAYENGHCPAFAVALAERIPDGKVVAYTDCTEDDERLIHMVAVDTNGNIFDVGGEVDEGVLEDWYSEAYQSDEGGWERYELEPNNVAEWMSDMPGNAPQDYPLARQVAGEWWSEHGNLVTKEDA
jgi:hypothetical protein